MKRRRLQHNNYSIKNSSNLTGPFLSSIHFYLKKRKPKISAYDLQFENSTLLLIYYIKTTLDM